MFTNNDCEIYLWKLFDKKDSGAGAGGGGGGGGGEREERQKTIPLCLKGLDKIIRNMSSDIRFIQ